MCSSSSSVYASSLFLLTDTFSPFGPRNGSVFTFPIPFFRNLRSTYPKFRLSASFADADLDLSWSFRDPNRNNDYGGWAIVESPARKPKRGLHPFVIGMVGTSLAVLIAAIAHFSLSRKGYNIQFGSPLHGKLSQTETKEEQGKRVEDDMPNDDAVVSEMVPEYLPDGFTDSVTSASVDKCERLLIPVHVDSAQEEALSVLKKLKIVEDDIKPGELCTRREYARWLVQINSSLERNPKHRVIPSILLSGSKIAAFTDVSLEDPDFRFIQALAEAGIIPSKLSPKTSGSEDQGNIYFFPERFITRQDLIDWRAQLEYDFVPGILEEMSITKVGFMDVKEISSDASPELFMDFLAEEKSIVGKVFGYIKRFQPNKPSTKAQAAVALASGRMTEAINTELSRIEAHNSAIKAEMEDIKSEFLERGDIQKFWDEKLNEEKIRGFEVEKVYSAAVSDLEEEKVVQEKVFSENLKEKAAVDCQRQLLLSLKEEVDAMTKKLASERAIYLAEKFDLQSVLGNLQTQREGMLDMKSILEAEKEALRILRSWVEDEARKSRARSKVLEEVGRRWKWGDQSGMP